MPVTGRYAPSPTGAMHLGNARTALLAWLHSRAQGGQHVLRIEDLDTARVRPGAADLIRRDLTWLGLDWDFEYIQSERRDLYAAALTLLPTYPCTCTRRQIAEAIHASAGAPHGPEAVYPGTCRAHHPSNPQAALRWRVPDETVCFNDGWTQTTLCQHLPSEVGDFVLRRGDGVHAYHLAVAVDDAEMRVTDVVRGADLLSSTPRQIALQRTLGLPTPRYFHVPLMTDFRGERLAKRGGAPSLAALRAGGVPAGRILSELATSLGWSVPAEIRAQDLLPIYESLLHKVIE
ncbi:tRNA glutamyl-Q(34) synthetase GluQRS [Deinococcus rubellus]|uniref:Glutamyl-Q tRNA(Asp) synthetase n=1 Tax=Deinococcus rubellus TaxID=1889240 RepID=A0ABY5YE17_9DEIO|nr:tRNA glutamyl-Q(34) synthetase GluQRS [Deinococcus rubellus]UWX63085.1 tRNA glutamyl-Q(34) synthetase GluQRS [Deinococcus rubellus]